MSPTNTIFISIDKSFFNLGLLFLEGIKKNYPKHPIIHICHSNLSKKHMDEMKQTDKNICFIENNIPEEMTGPIMAHLNPKKFDAKVFYARFMLWNEYFRKFDKILHLDVDMYIAKPLDSLFEKTGFYIVKDVYEGHDFKNLNDLGLQRELLIDGFCSLPQGSNAGVFLLTKDFLNKNTLMELMDIKNRYKNYIRFADQSIISIWMKKNNITPSEEFQFNYQFRLFFMNYKNNLNDISIIHLNGLSKNLKILFMRLFIYGFFNKFVRINQATRGYISKMIF